MLLFVMKVVYFECDTMVKRVQKPSKFFEAINDANTIEEVAILAAEVEISDGVWFPCDELGLVIPTEVYKSYFGIKFVNVKVVSSITKGEIQIDINYFQRNKAKQQTIFVDLENLKILFSGKSNYSPIEKT